MWWLGVLVNERESTKELVLRFAELTALMGCVVVRDAKTSVV